MHTDGTFAPETRDAARERYDALVPTAKTVVREVARAMEFDRAEYGERVTEDVVATARDALFAESLAVHVGTQAEFDEWLAGSEYAEESLTVLGSPNVEQVAWHAVPFADRVVATTFHEEEAAAVSTLRRQVFGRIYREVLE